MLARALLFLLATALLAQRLSFDAASIKPGPTRPPDKIDPAPPGGPGTSDPGRVRYTLISLKSLLMKAYDVKSFQISGPDWLGSERFDIEATMPPATTQEQFQAMLQNLLADRFNVSIHHERRELPIYSLVIAKGGVKLRESTDSPQESKAEYGFPALRGTSGERPRTMELSMRDRARFIGYRQTIRDLADHLSGPLTRPVIDATGLAGTYDFTLTFSLEGIGIPNSVGSGSEAEAPPDIFNALQTQLGLKLEPKRGEVDFLVIDHIERTPTAN
jgi:uncharacterized protein (TIGR03435 family)